MINRLCPLLAIFLLVPLSEAADGAGPHFTKTKLYFLDAPKKSPLEPNQDRSIEFERKRAVFGAITPSEQRERYGNYFTFFWSSPQSADVTVRLEYRQQNLGPMVQAKEQEYRGASGHLTTRFSVIGDDFLQHGRVLAWRAILRRGGVVISERKSFLWRDH